MDAKKHENELKELESLRLATQVRESVEADLRKRYSWLGLLFVFLTSGVFLLLVEKTVAAATSDMEDRVDAAIQASDQDRHYAKTNLEVAKALQKESSIFLKEAAGDARDLAEEAQRTAQDFQDWAEDISEELKEAEGRMAELNENATRLMDDLERQGGFAIDSTRQLAVQMESLTEIVNGLASEHAGEAENIEDVKKALAEAQHRIDQESMRANASIQSRFEVRLLDVSGADQVQAKLVREGYTVDRKHPERGDRYSEPARPEEGILVVVPEGAPMGMIQDVLATARDELGGTITHIMSDRFLRSPKGFTIGLSPKMVRGSFAVPEEGLDRLLDPTVTKEEFWAIITPPASSRGLRSSREARDASAVRGGRGAAETPR